MKSFSVAVIVFTCVVAAGAESLPPKVMPSWLTAYPGAKAEAGSATEMSYGVAAKPEEVIAHYKKLLLAAALPFVPNFDGIGTSIRAAAEECDLLIRIRESDNGTVARINCTVRIAGSGSSLYGTDVGIANPPPPVPEKAEAAAPEKEKTAPDPEPDPKKQAEAAPKGPPQIRN